MTREKSQRDRLITDITHYLKAHPNAADSVEGIMQWWLPTQQNSVDEYDLQQVLDYLVEIKALSRTELLDGRMLYSSKENASSNKMN